MMVELCEFRWLGVRRGLLQPENSGGGSRGKRRESHQVLLIACDIRWLIIRGDVRVGIESLCHDFCGPKLIFPSSKDHDFLKTEHHMLVGIVSLRYLATFRNEGGKRTSIHLSSFYDLQDLRCSADSDCRFLDCQVVTWFPVFVSNRPSGVSWSAVSEI